MCALAATDVNNGSTMTRLVSPLRRAMAGGMILIGMQAMQACQDVSITAVDVASLEVAPSEGSLRAGETLQLSATLRDTDGNVLQQRPVAWRSEDGSVAAVGPDGLVEARGAGETRIRASSGTAEALATILVREALQIAISDSELRFDAEAGNGPTAYASLEVTAGGGDPVTGLSASVHYASGQPDDWLHVDLQGSETPATLRARATAEELEAGIYEAEIRLRADGVEDARNVRVVFAVDAPAPSIRLSSGAVEFERVAGGPPPSPKTVEITNTGGGQLTGLQASVDYASGQPSGWLGASLASTTAPASLALSVAASGPGPGRYEATVRVSAGVADNSPRTVTVVLEVRSPDVSTRRSDVSASPDEIPADGESTAAITVQLRDDEGRTIAPTGASVSLDATRGSLSSVTNRGGGRYTATLTSSTSAGTAVVTATVDGAVLDESATVRFTAVEPPPGSSALRVASIEYEGHGGADSDRHVWMRVRVVDAAGAPVSGARVTGRLRHESGRSEDATGTSESNGVATLKVENLPLGCFVTTIRSVEASGREWDGETPNNQYCRG